MTYAEILRHDAVIAPLLTMTGAVVILLGATMALSALNYFGAAHKIRRAFAVMTTGLWIVGVGCATYAFEICREAVRLFSAYEIYHEAVRLFST